MKQSAFFPQVVLSLLCPTLLFSCSHGQISKDDRQPASGRGLQVAGQAPSQTRAVRAKPPIPTYDFTVNPPLIVDSFFSPATPQLTALYAQQMNRQTDMPFADSDDPSLSHWPIVSLIKSAKSGTEFHMIMFNLSDRDIVTAMVDAQKRGVLVTLIIDHSHYCKAYPEKTVECPPPKIAKPTADSGKESGTDVALNALIAGGVTVIASSKDFGITHAKSFSFLDQSNRKTLVVTSMNETQKGAIIRDFGVVTNDEAAFDEFEAVFQTDILNAQLPPHHNEPNLAVTNLAWSPVNSRDKLVSLIDSAPQNGEIDLTVEEFTFTATDMISALKSAAQDRHVKVYVLLPVCQDPTMEKYVGENANNMTSLLDFNSFASTTSAPLDARANKGPPTLTNPYIHQKMILVKDASGIPLRAYVGSINFSEDSLKKARELGIIITNDHVRGSDALKKINLNFLKDWNGPQNPSAILDRTSSAQAVTITELKQPGLCPATPK